ncbi:hypothetical protein PRIPAC_85188 [Pristionchus pacificus]|uniref:Uncharacterized protein n=1 Tax=Pristionchus pacificus TaxID=54126 RepID=A0A2A6BDG7_PRIPA|nr:hypothetical protein PRIPAC_85188 [Pristionchus pacificus]|eukprot:PDM63914.1 hypothetical protein PRIPAC_53697 [Pristionchus pacificus]
MSDSSTFIQLLPDIQETLSSSFSLVDCSLGIGPDLSRPPFSLPFRNLGQQVTFVPDSTVIEDVDRSCLHSIPLGEKSFVLTDSKEGTVIEIALEGGNDWISPLTQLFHNIFQSKWTFLVAEVENSTASFHVITSKGTKCNNQLEKRKTESTNFSLWIVPVSKIFAVPPPVKKVKIVKKVIKKKSPIETSENVVKKKKVESSNEVYPGMIQNGTNVNKRDEISTFDDANKGKEKEINKDEDINGQVKAAIPCEKKPSETLSNGEKGDTSNGMDTLFHSKPLELISHNESLPSPSVNTFLPSSLCGMIERKEEEEISDDEDIVMKLRKEIMERERLIGIGEERIKKDLSINRSSNRSPPNHSSPSLTSICETRTRSIRRSSDEYPIDIPMGRSGTFMKHRSIDISPPSHSSIPISSLPSIPVLPLQILGFLRAVHPHWDEICGQLLNGGYYSLLERTDRMLMKYQRRVHSDSSLLYPVAILTNIQVHILNPVDIMRAALDEGICCFPYGVIIDKTISILNDIEKMVEAGEKRDILWESVGVLARRASLHYRNTLEDVMEERMGTCVRLKAAQRIIRMDSMIVEHNVNKLEKESIRARDDIRWELEQLQQSNGILKKENRQLKADQMRLESRIESLENKLRSICRLLS